jgi:hypothetical protein
MYAQCYINNDENGTESATEKIHLGYPVTNG